MTRNKSSAYSLRQRGRETQASGDVLGCLKVLRKLKFQNCMSLEYEENPKNPLSDIEVCLRVVREAAAKL